MAGRKYSKEQKDEFFRLLDKGGIVRAAARAVGVHQDAGYSWLRNSGLTMQRATPRTYSPEDKAEFFRRLADNPNVSTVARELGFARIISLINGSVKDQPKQLSSISRNNVRHQPKTKWQASTEVMQDASAPTRTRT
jgi:transposase-like protein